MTTESETATPIVSIDDLLNPIPPLGLREVDVAFVSTSPPRLVTASYRGIDWLFDRAQVQALEDAGPVEGARLLALHQIEPECADLSCASCAPLRAPAGSVIVPPMVTLVETIWLHGIDPQFRLLRGRVNAANLVSLLDFTAIRGVSPARVLAFPR